MTLWRYLTGWIWCGIYLTVPAFSHGTLAALAGIACFLDLLTQQQYPRPHPIEI